MSPYLVQVDFPSEGPFGSQMAVAYHDLAESITREPGFLWKIWTENEDAKSAGGIYLFESKETAEKYLDMHTKRLATFGVTDIRGKIFAVNDTLSKICKGPIGQ